MFFGKWRQARGVSRQPPSAADCIKQGNELLGRGKLEEAKEQYEAALGMAPANVDARVNLGFVWTQLGRDEAAKKHLQLALEVAPDQHDAHYLLGLIEERSGNIENAVQHLAGAVASNPGFEAARRDLARLYFESDRLADAKDVLEQGLLATPRSATLQLYLGFVYIRQELWQSAIEAFKGVLAIEPEHAEALLKMGDAHRELGCLEEALASYDRAIRIRPEDAESHNNRGVALIGLNRLEEALTSFERAILWDPEYAQAYSNRGLALHRLNRLDASVEAYNQALDLRPGFLEAVCNRGLVLDELGRLSDALADHDQALEIEPGFSQAHFNRGNTLKKLGRLEESLAAYDQSIHYDPTSSQGYNNRGLVLAELGRFEDALVSLGNASRLTPDFAEAHLNEGITRLLLGDFARGWEEYHWRWQYPGLKEALRNDLAPLWLGQSNLQGKAILLYSEQGFGDAIQFCRYARDVAALGAKVILEVQPPLVSLFSDLAGVDVLVRRGDPLPPVDFQCPLLSLPLAFRTELSDIKGDPYLKSSPEKMAAWSRLLGPPIRPRVGLVWSGNPTHQNDRNRSVVLADFMEALIPDADYICLQKDIRPEDSELLARHPEVRLFDPQLGDFSDTAALVDAMDLVISVDTSVAHLAGALGKPVWILLPYAPDWRWLLDRSDSPWYRSATLFRQARPGDWAGVFEEIGRRLQALSVQEH